MTDIEKADLIFKEVCNFYGHPIELVKCTTKGNRGRFTVTARQFYCKLAKAYTKLSLVNIGVPVGYKHDLVIYHLRKADENIRYNDAGEEFERLKLQVNHSLYWHDMERWALSITQL